MKKTLINMLAVMAVLFGVSLTASAADSQTADFNSGLPEGWSLVGNINNDSDRVLDLMKQFQNLSKIQNLLAKELGDRTVKYCL